MLKKTLSILVAIAAVGAVVLAGWYQVDGQPLPEAGQYLQAGGFSARVEDDGGLLFTPASSNGTATFSIAVMVGIRWKAWKTIPT